MTVVYVNTFTKGNGVAPDDFVLSGVGAVGGVCSGGKWHLSTTTAGDVSRGILPTGKWLSADGKATAWWTTQPTSTGNVVPQIQLRTSGDWSSEVDSPTTGYKCLFLNGSGFGLFERHAGTTTFLNPGGVWVAKTIAPASLYGFTLQVVGNQISARMWAGGTEPSTWDIGPITNSAVTGPGQFQVAMLSQDATPLFVDFDDISLDDLQTAATGPRPRLMRV